MKLLLENWREFLKEDIPPMERLPSPTTPPQLVKTARKAEQAVRTRSQKEMAAAAAKSSRRAEEKASKAAEARIKARERFCKKKPQVCADQEKLANLQKMHTPEKLPGVMVPAMAYGIQTDEAQDQALMMLSMVEPTGIMSYVDVQDAYINMVNDRTAASAGWLIVAILSAIPGLGKTMAPIKAAKLARIKKAIARAEKIARRSKKTKAFPSVQIERAIPAARAEIAELQEYTDIFQQHMVDNIPIDKVTALRIIEKFPSLKVTNKAVYRGMRVDANFIKKNFGDDVFRTCCSGDPGTYVLEVNTTLKPRSKSGTSSWSLDPGEGDLWAQGHVRDPKDKPYEILYMGGGKNSKGLNITKAAKDMGHPMASQDFAEVSMIGPVGVKKVVIVNNAPKGGTRPRSIYAVEKQAKQKHRVPAVKAIDLPAGFYPAGSRKEILKLIGVPTSLKESIVKKQLIRVRIA